MAKLVDREVCHLWNWNGSGASGSAGFTGQVLGSSPPSWQIAGTGHFNSSGSDGILWQHASTGDVPALELEWLGGLHRGRPGAFTPVGRLWEPEISTAVSGEASILSGSLVDWRCPAMETEMARGLHLRKPGRRQHQLADRRNRRFQRQRRRRHPVAQRRTGASSSGTRKKFGLSRRTRPTERRTANARGGGA